MRLRACALVLGLGGLGALASTPSLALTVQAAPPRPDIAQHLHSSPTTPVSGVLPAPSELTDSFVSSERPQAGQAFTGPAGGRTTSFNVGPLHATSTVTPGYGAFWNDASPRANGNPLALTPPRH